VVNIGDAMSIFTNGLLKSIRHRVVKSWGREAEYKRYSVLYGLRPDDDAIMSEIGTDGKPVTMENGEKAATAAEWGDAKFKFLIAGRGFVRDPTKEAGKPEGKIFGY
jgi:isopenicillin N synthase-like dioxygenase